MSLAIAKRSRVLQREVRGEDPLPEHVRALELDRRARHDRALQYGEDLLRGEARLHPGERPFREDAEDRSHDLVDDELHVGGHPRVAHVDHPAAHREQERLHPAGEFRVPSGENHQRPLRGGFPASQHGRFEIVGAGAADHAFDLARRVGRDGRHVDVRLPRRQGGEEAAFRGDDVPHGGGVGDHRDRDVGSADEVRERRRGVRPRGDQRSHLRRCPVVHRDVVAFRQEVPAHRLAHDPQPDKPHLRHRSPSPGERNRLRNSRLDAARRSIRMVP
ncbi:MAG: hypothetical protein H6Q82_2981 [Deltaproteobacteria bacterium]|nr:hypothetical protein [Deltaproteobacteria bacterium]